MKEKFVTGVSVTAAGAVPVVATRLDPRDYVGILRARLGIRRDSYRIEPGLYAVGSPDERSEILVTSNYKLTFDTVRANIGGLDVWLLVLDTGGINVWCAAGKGTFGTEELVRRIQLASLDKLVKHRRLILPQLGASGVAAHLVKRRSGFTVLYGPVRASEIRAFIGARYRADSLMRRVRFGFADRVKLIPVDFVSGARYVFGAAALFFIAAGISREGFSIQHALESFFPSAVNVLAAYCAGIVVTPMALPYIPVRSFASKGILAGLALTVGLLPFHTLGGTAISVIAWFLFIPGLASFVAMNFTGSSTYTSLSGVKKEMRIALPVQLAFAGIAFILIIADRLF